MKKSMQVICMAAFLGCFAVLAIAAGKDKHTPGKCNSEWKNFCNQDNEKSTSAIFWPAQLFYAVL